MHLLLSLVVILLCDVAISNTTTAQTRAAKGVEIYVVDVEGGNAKLFVSPSGESVLIDTGNAGGTTGRDPGRILDAVKDAGLQQIDHLITTHWHGDHFGRMAEVTAKISIRDFISAQQDGSFSVTNSRNSFSKTYKPRN